MKNLLILQSGGPTSVINASLVGIINTAKEIKDINRIYGSINGILGVLEDNLIMFDDVSNDYLNLIKTTPAAYLGSARHKLPNDIYDDNNNLNIEYLTVLNVLKKYDIKYISIIGGNDSMDTVNKLNIFFNKLNLDINVIGVPKTIDNDLILTDHTPGYGSAIKYIASVVSEIKLDTSVYKLGRVTIVEIMGRDSGWLTCGASLARLNGLGPDLIYLPEIPFNIDTFLEDVKKVYAKNHKVLVCISEGIKDHNNEYILSSYSYKSNNDVFGHMQLGGTSTYLAKVIKDNLNIPVRSLELSLPQRCAGHILSKTDVEEAYLCGKCALNNVLTSSGKFVIMTRSKGEEYSINYEVVDVSKVANKVKDVPLEYIVNGNNVSDEFIKYALPLIKGEVDMKYENGLPKYAYRKDL